MSNLYIIIFNSATRYCALTCLHFIEKYILLALLIILTKQIIYLIYKNRFLLFANNNYKL